MEAGSGDLMRRVATAAVFTAVLLAVLKAVAFLLTDSMAMLASFADSALDTFASFVNLLAVRHALQPADNEHRFGHGKAEPLAGLAQGAFIGGSAVFLAMQSVQRLIEPQPIAHELAGLAVMAISIFATVLLVLAQRYVIRRTGSLAITADHAHYVSDLLVNAGVIIGLVLATKFQWHWADPAAGLAVAILIARTAWEVGHTSYDQLMDRELPENARARIRAILLAHPDINAIHDLRTRIAGVTPFIQVHIELDPALSLGRAHSISDEAEAHLRAVYPQADIIIHQDVCGGEKPSTLARS